MKNITYILLFCGLILCNYEKSFGWDSTAAKYMPLQVGNTWVYRFIYNVMGGSIGYDKVTITNQVFINGKYYYAIALNRRYTYQGIECNSRVINNISNIRIDSISGNLLNFGSCNSSSEMLLDSLSAKLNDSFYICPASFQGNKVKCTDTNSYLYYGQTRKTKKFRISTSEGYNSQTYVENIGLVYYEHIQLMGLCSETLRGCVINGVLYGDTSFVVGINQVSFELPARFSLYQNYPNPFNPVTNFEFIITDYGLVKLTVFDVLGKEVEILLNRDLQPGSYKVDWDASVYPSGVYYYKLEVSPSTGSGRGFTETKKMVLIK